MWTFFQIIIMFIGGCIGIEATENLPDLQKTATLVGVFVGWVVAYLLTRLISLLADSRQRATARRGAP